MNCRDFAVIMSTPLDSDVVASDLQREVSNTCCCHEACETPCERQEGN